MKQEGLMLNKQIPTSLVYKCCFDQFCLAINVILYLVMAMNYCFHYDVPASQVCPTLQIFIVILLCKSIKVMGEMYKLMIGNFFCKITVPCRISS